MNKYISLGLLRAGLYCAFIFAHSCLWVFFSQLRFMQHFNFYFFLPSSVTYRNFQNVSSVLDLLDLDDDVRVEVLQMTASQTIDAANFCNNYPSIEVHHSLDNDGTITV